jgi:hypothetical protein
VSNVDDRPRGVVEELNAGRSWRTPFLAIGGVMLVIAALFVVALVLAVVAYLLA